MAVAHRIYARALYEAAQGQGRVDVAREQLGELASALEATPELESFLANPQLDPGAKASVLDEVTAGADVGYAFALLRCGEPEELRENPARRLRITFGLRRDDDGCVVAHEHHSFPLL